MVDKTIALTCRQCSEGFEYTLKEFKRQTKLGRTKDQFYCSISCSTLWRNSHMSTQTRSRIGRATSKRMVGNTYNKKGVFTTYLRLIRKREPDSPITELDLQTAWNKCEGRCSLSGVNMTLKYGKQSPTTASVDRISSQIGYTAENIQFVCFSMNLAKNVFTDDEMKEFITLLRTAPI
jgi:hypothetical protein